jgi:hypothetical protein
MYLFPKFVFLSFFGSPVFASGKNGRTHHLPTGARLTGDGTKT